MSVIQGQGRPIQKRSLHELLEAVTNVHKRDIHDFAGGHLNEAKLWKPKQHDGEHSGWKSAKKKPIKSVPKSKLLHPPKADAAKVEHMKETMTKFSVGIGGAVSQPLGARRKSPKGSRSPVKLEGVTLSRETSAGSYSKQDDGVLVEELQLQKEVILPSPRPHRHVVKSWAQEDMDSNKDIEKPPSQRKLKDINLQRMKNTLTSGHLAAVTKKDQFNKMKEFEHDVLRKQETMEQNVLSGNKAVEHLEEKLQQDLDILDFNSYGPNFHRLQVYGNTFDDLIEESSTFGYMLKIIKQEYDSYVSSLLDTQSTKHKLLYEQVEQLSARGTSNPQLLQQEVHSVVSLEHEGKKLLEENERLRKEVERELELAQEPESEAPKKSKTYKDEPPLELMDQVEELHATILEKLDAMNHLRQKLRKEYVPATVCTHLEQCIKETEVEIQKLTSQKEYFDANIQEMETELQEAIDNADTTERDARRVWRKVRKVKSLDSGRSRVTATSDGSSTYTSKTVSHKIPEDSDDDQQDDETKWNWYIS